MLSSVGASADHLESPVLAAELARVLYDGMDLVLKEPIRWDQRRENLRVAHIGLSIQEQLDITGSAYPMRTAIERLPRGRRCLFTCNPEWWVPFLWRRALMMRRGGNAAGGGAGV